MQIMDKGILESLLEAHPLEESFPPTGLAGPRHLTSAPKPHGLRHGSARPGLPSAPGSPRSTEADERPNWKGKARVSPEERKRMEIASKWEKTEAQRQRDYKNLTERAEQRRDMRHARCMRLVESVTGQNSLASITATALREGMTRERHRRRELHEAWDSKVHQPLANQAHDHLNPPNRRKQQLIAGTKSVALCVSPDKQKPKLKANILEDPARKPVIDFCLERAFHTDAEAVLRGSQSAPDLHPGQRTIGASPLLQRAMGRPTLEPTAWGQVTIEGTMLGHVAKVGGPGSEMKRSKKGGANVHVPDENDGILVAGTRVSRERGNRDLGILRGDYAARGEASQHKTDCGRSSGAPLQDHYGFHGGREVSDLEFPAGKRMFPEFH